MKQLTREQLEGRKARAVSFTKDVVGDAARADEIADESLEDYAGRRGFEILNPRRRATMPRKTVEDYREEVADLKDQLAEVEEENESLQSQLDQIADIAAGEEEGEDDEEPGEAE